MNYTIEDMIKLMKDWEAEQLYGSVVLVYQAGEITAFKITTINKKADGETIRKPKQVSPRGLQRY